MISEVSAHRNCGALEIRVLLLFLSLDILHGGKKTLIVVDRLNSNMFIVFQAVQELRLQGTSLIHSCSDAVAHCAGACVRHLQRKLGAILEFENDHSVSGVQVPFHVLLYVFVSIFS